MGHHRRIKRYGLTPHSEKRELCEFWLTRCLSPRAEAVVGAWRFVLVAVTAIEFGGLERMGHLLLGCSWTSAGPTSHLRQQKREREQERVRVDVRVTSCCYRSRYHRCRAGSPAYLACPDVVVVVVVVVAVVVVVVVVVPGCVGRPRSSPASLLVASSR